MYREINPDRVIETLEILGQRIEQRFPNSGLGRVCQELLEIARETQARCEWIARPNMKVRTGIGVLVLLLVAVLVESVLLVRMDSAGYALGDFIQILDSGISALVFLGAALVFLFTVETRIKRQRALKAIAELRSIIHVIDMHQLTKDPDRLTSGYQSTSLSPKIEMDVPMLTRYLNYCSELLSLTGKIGALYSQYIQDSQVLVAVNEIESVATGLARKIWQKIMVLRIEE
jgi:hypothetical protein